MLSIPRPKTLGLSAFLFLSILSWSQPRADELPMRFFQTHCVDCHQAEEANADVRLDHVADREWSQPSTSEFLERVLKAVRHGDMPPPDASTVSEAERQDAVNRLHQSLLAHADDVPTVVRRLSHAEYRQSIRDVFGIEFDLPPGFPADNGRHGFTNSAEGLVISAPLMEAYFQTAISVADQIIPPPRKPVESTRVAIPADELVISYSSGVVVEGAMRLAARSEPMWRSCTWPEKFEVRQAGTYRMRISASKFAPGSKAWPSFKEPLEMQIRARSLNGKDGDPIGNQRLLKSFHVDTRLPGDFEFVAEMQPAETPVIYFANALIDGDREDRDAFKELLHQLFVNDMRLLAGWQGVEHSNGLRGGIGWDRVKAIRDSSEIDLAQIDFREESVEKLVKKMASNPGLYAETVVYQFFEEGPSLQIHEVEIEGPLEVTDSAAEKKRRQIAQQFLGDRGDQSEQEFVHDFLRRFLTKAFRRPANEVDVAHYTRLVRQQMQSGLSLDAGLHLAIRTALMSPKFLFRGRQPGVLDEFDLAARLSYFLSSAPPDDELYQAAVDKSLLSNAQLRDQAERLLESPESRRFVADFTSQWLETRELEDIMPDARLLPNFSPEHRSDMITEIELLFAEILENDLPLKSFILPGFSFVNQRLADDIYEIDGFEGQGQEFKRVVLTADMPYGGLLGAAGTMMATANGVDTQPVVRGVWVLENILGDPPPPPPESVPALTPDTSNAQGVRELLARHRSEDSCATCHRRIDPLGFVLENFDPIGRWRTHYPTYAVDADGKTAVEQGAPIDARCEFPGGIELESVRDLKDYVASNIDDFANCLSQKLLTYATGRRMNYADKQEIAEIVARVVRSGGGFRQLMISLIDSDTFRTR